MGIKLRSGKKSQFYIHCRMVQNSEWGPHLWNILHMCAEKCGKQSTYTLHIDQVRAWIQLLKLTEAILPCALCQKHYKEWLHTHKLSSFLEKRISSEFHEAAKKWVWKLHNHVNKERKISELDYEHIIPTYSLKTTKDLQESIEKLKEVLERAKLQRQVDGIYIREWFACLSSLRRLMV